MPSQRNVRTRVLSEPHSISDLGYWFEQQDSRTADLRQVYNSHKRRFERWHRSLKGNKEWILHYAKPARIWEEAFIGQFEFVLAILGVFLNHSWSTNGDPSPTIANFSVLTPSEIGGGLALITAATNGEWVALHIGDNYPTALKKSPHVHIKLSVRDLDNMHVLAGLVCSDNLETGNDSPWTTPDDGIWIEYDTDLDDNMQFVTSNGGTRTRTALRTLTATDHIAYDIQSHDNTWSVKCLVDGTTVANHTTNLPHPQTCLKPIFMVRTREDAVKTIHLHDFRMIFDRGE